jgi:hypothetical protein
VPLAKGLDEAISMVEPDPEDGAEGEGWQEHNDADVLLLFLGVCPVEQVAEREIEGDDGAKDRGDAGEDDNEFVEGYGETREVDGIVWC